MMCVPKGEEADRQRNVVRIWFQNHPKNPERDKKMISPRLEPHRTVLLCESDASGPGAGKCEPVKQLEGQNEPWVHEEGHENGSDGEGSHGSAQEGGCSVSLDDGSAENREARV